jgi:hypothetical protein
MNIPTQEIPRESWMSYFNDVSKIYQGWQVDVEILGRDYGDESEVKGLPLQGLSYESAGSAANDILVEAGELPVGYTTHHVRKPTSVRAAPTVPGIETDIEIQSEEGYTTLVHIRQRPGLPS